MNPDHTYPYYFPKVNSNIIFQSMPKFSKISHPLWFPNQNIVYSESVTCRLQTFYVPPDVFPKNQPNQRPCVTFQNMVLYGEELLAHSPIPKTDDYPFSAVSDSFNIFVATFHTWRPSPPSATLVCVMPW